MPWDFALVLLVLGVVAPWRAAVRLRRLLRVERISSAERLGIYATTILFQWLATGIVLWRALARGISLADLGVATGHPDRALAAGMSVSLAVSFGQFLSLRSLAKLPPEQQGIPGELARKLMPQDSVEALVFLALAGTVAVCEEFLYRGFALEIMKRASGSLLVGALVSTGMFAFAHLYQGRQGIVVTFLAGLLFCAMRIWSAGLAPSLAAHFCADLVAGLSAPRLLRAGAAEGP